MINFCFDSLGNHGIGYPNLATAGLNPSEFDQTWPFTIPFRIQMYLFESETPYNIHTVELAPPGSWYPISLGWHNFDCDYFAMLTESVKLKLKNTHIKLLFYYHEGDNPQRIKNRFDQLCVTHNLPKDCYLFVSANGAATELENFYYFSDHESFFKYVNRRQAAGNITGDPRDYNFTAINRAHKWWRATCMSQLKQQGILAHSLWSYNSNCLVGDQFDDNPISLKKSQKILLQKFVEQGPYFCDSDNADAHNDHRYVTEHLYTHSYCHIVLETLYDADQSNGAFITEKTYKCIKFAQPFVIIGAAYSLEALRQDGYRVFDQVIDNSYDSIEDNNLRWAALQKTISKIKSHPDMHQWYLECLPDLQHNQQLFMSKKTPALERLISRLTTDSNPV
jgi:hypothetical protein